MSFTDQTWLMRFRSSSCSSDLDLDKSLTKSKPKIESRTRAYTSSVASCHHYSSPQLIASSLALGHEMLVSQPMVFPFASLTEDCKLRILAELTPAERGVAACVCHEWSALIHTPTLWSVIDLVTFPPHPKILSDDTSLDDCLQIYECYCARLKHYISYLASIHPNVRAFRFELDIGDVQHGWLDALQSLLRASQLQDLEHAELGWTETQGKPYIPDNCSATWCASDCKDLMYRHRHRQRLFVKFFDLFTALASNVVSLTLPFDWTDRSLRALHRLPNIEVLNLQKYFVFQALDQTMIDSLFSSAPLLRHLTMEIWTPSGRGLQKFSFYSDNLVYLDVSRCRGFYIEELVLPHLLEFKICLCPMNGPLVSGEGVDVKCLFSTLQVGARSLSFLNNLKLQDDWYSSSPDDELETLLKTICACPAHQSD